MTPSACWRGPAHECSEVEQIRQVLLGLVDDLQVMTLRAEIAERELSRLLSAAQVREDTEIYLP